MSRRVLAWRLLAWLQAAVLMGGLAVACGDTADTTVPEAATCDALAEDGVDLLEVTFAEIDRLQEAGDATETVPPVLEEFRAEVARRLARQDELKCNPDDIDTYFCANVDRLQPQRSIAKEMLAETIQETCQVD